MKKLLILATVLTLSSASAATWQELLTPSDAAMAAACSAGARVESMPRTTAAQSTAYQDERSKARSGFFLDDSRSLSNDPTARLLAMLSTIRLQLPAGSAYVICGKAAQRLEATPNLGSRTNSFIAYISGRTTAIKNAQTFNAVLALLDESGKELQRLQPTSSLKGDSSYWDVSCRSTPCTWSGQNLYHFSFPESLDSTIAKTKTIKLLFTRGNGVEERIYAPEDFQAGTLKDPPQTGK